MQLLFINICYFSDDRYESTMFKQIPELGKAPEIAVFSRMKKPDPDFLLNGLAHEQGLNYFHVSGIDIFDIQAVQVIVLH